MTPVMTDMNLYYIKFMLLISDIFPSRWSNQVSGRRNMRLNDFKSTSVSVSFSLAHAASLFLSSWLMWHWGGQACHTSSGSYGVTQQTSRAQKWSGPSLPVGVSLFFFIPAPEHRQAPSHDGGNEKSHDTFMRHFLLFIICQSLPN